MYRMNIDLTVLITGFFVGIWLAAWLLGALFTWLGFGRFSMRKKPPPAEFGVLYILFGFLCRLAGPALILLGTLSIGVLLLWYLRIIAIGI